MREGNERLDGIEVDTCCKVEAIIPVDERGQLVLPKDIRERAGISGSGKLAVIGIQLQGQIFCIALMKADSLGKTVRDVLGPMFNSLLRS